MQQVVRACFEAGVPWVARGSGTGLSGGALPIAEGVLIVLARLRRILSVDLDDGLVVVEPGVTNLAVSNAVAPSHFYPPDPSSQIVCSIGGNVAENSGGAHCFKYGFTTNYVVGLEVVLSDGTIVNLRRDDPGYDLLGAFVGSEGTLGVATKISLRVVPAPESVQTMLAFFEDTGAAGDAVSAIVGEGHVPGAIEMMDRLSIEAAEQATGAGYRLDAGSGAAGRARRRARAVLRRARTADGAVRRSGRARREGRPERRRARSDLAYPQGGVRRDGPDRPGVLRAGRRDPAHASRGRAAARSTRSPPSTTCGLRTSSTPVTGTSIRWSATTPRARGRRSAPRSCRG